MNIFLSKGRWFYSPGLHVEAFLGKILNPKLLLMVGTLHGSHRPQCTSVCMNYCKSLWTKEHLLNGNAHKHSHAFAQVIRHWVIMQEPTLQLFILFFQWNLSDRGRQQTHAHFKGKSCWDKGQTRRRGQRRKAGGGAGEESEGEAQRAWSFVSGNKVLVNDLLVPCVFGTVASLKNSRLAD